MKLYDSWDIDGKSPNISNPTTQQPCDKRYQPCRDIPGTFRTRQNEFGSYFVRGPPRMSVPAVICSNAVKRFTCLAGRVSIIGIIGKSGVWVAQDCRSDLNENTLQTTTTKNRWLLKWGNGSRRSRRDLFSRKTTTKMPTDSITRYFTCPAVAAKQDAKNFTATFTSMELDCRPWRAWRILHVTLRQLSATADSDIKSAENTTFHLILFQQGCSSNWHPIWHPLFLTYAMWHLSSFTKTSPCAASSYSLYAN